MKSLKSKLGCCSSRKGTKLANMLCGRPQPSPAHTMYTTSISDVYPSVSKWSDQETARPQPVPRPCRLESPRHAPQQPEARMLRRRLRLMGDVIDAARTRYVRTVSLRAPAQPAEKPIVAACSSSAMRAALSSVRNAPGRAPAPGSASCAKHATRVSALPPLDARWHFPRLGLIALALSALRPSYSAPEARVGASPGVYLPTKAQPTYGARQIDSAAAPAVAEPRATERPAAAATTANGSGRLAPPLTSADLFNKLTQSALYKQAEEADRALEGIPQSGSCTLSTHRCSASLTQRVGLCREGAC